MKIDLDAIRSEINAILDAETTESLTTWIRAKRKKVADKK